MVALVVAKEVVSWAAELVAAEAVVVLVAAEADLEVELSHDTVVLQALPLPAGVDHPWVDSFLNNWTADTCEYNGLNLSEITEVRWWTHYIVCQLLQSKDKLALNWEKQRMKREGFYCERTPAPQAWKQCFYIETDVNDFVY